VRVLCLSNIPTQLGNKLEGDNDRVLHYSDCLRLDFSCVTRLPRETHKEAQITNLAIEAAQSQPSCPNS
jgi:hypothetical protein